MVLKSLKFVWVAYYLLNWLGSNFEQLKHNFYPIIKGSTCSYFRLVYWQNSSMLTNSFACLLSSVLIFSINLTL